MVNYYLKEFINHNLGLISKRDAQLKFAKNYHSPSPVITKNKNYTKKDENYKTPNKNK